MTYTKDIQLDPVAGKTKVEQTKWKNISLSSVPHQTGIAGDDLFETKVPFNRLVCENVIEGKNDSYIVLGRDRFGSELEGKGMVGEPLCAMVDMVVGRHGNHPREPIVRPDGTFNVLDPSFKKDAARIYLAQRTDVDEVFGIAEGKVGNFVNRSAVTLKADGLRMLAREGIKLVTMIDKVNSFDVDVSKYGIDLIALNDDTDMQPIPKGNNLEQCLIRLTYHVKDLNKIVKRFLSYQMKFNKVVQEHVHISPFWGQDTSPSLGLEMIDGPPIIKDLEEKINGSLKSHMKNLLSFELTYLDRTNSKKYINSYYNHTN